MQKAGCAPEVTILSLQSYIIIMLNSERLRAASPKYRLNQEIAKKSNFFKLAQNEVFRALVTKIIV